jgi:hypothetical protein
LFPLFATGVNNTGCKLAASVIDTGGTPAANLPPVSLTPVANLPLVSTSGPGGKFVIGVNALTCEYLREFSKKFEMTLMLFSGAWEKVIHEKKPEAKNLVSL